MTEHKKKVAFVLYPGLTILDMVGPLQVFSTLPLYNRDYEPVVVGADLAMVGTDTPLTVGASKTFADVPDPAVVIVPGGGAPTIRAMADPAVRAYLLSVADGAQVVASVCTGALILGAAGFLEGRKATTHWMFHSALERLGATYVPQRWVEDGKFLTAAGVSAGIDMALHLVTMLTDQQTAMQVQLMLEYDPQPPATIDWNTVDRDVLTAGLPHMMRAELADSPELLARLTD